MKIKDLPDNTNLNNIQFIYPGDNQKYYWTSQWEKGVWGKKSIGDSQIIPLFVEDLQECLEWDIVNNEN